jgi:NAD(P)-dependent dehydrogenase (short-subunit alcohol dehydrogenase family)
VPSAVEDEGMHVGERAVVTGANSGIGLATALRLARDGHDVFATSRRSEGLETIEAAASSAGVANVRPITMDVTDSDSVSAAFAAILDDGPVTALVNNAGITGAGSVEETDLATYQAMFDTNVLGVVRCTQQVLPGMREQRRGRIVNMSSSSAIVSPPLMSAYASTKYAVEAISESLQAEVAPFGIRVIAVQAGTILTPIWGKSEAPPADTAYGAARDFLMQVLTHNLTKSGVPAETVADAIADAIEAERPALRRTVGDAEVLAAVRDKHGDDAVEVFFLDGDEFRARYRDMSGIDYWA